MKRHQLWIIAALLLGSHAAIADESDPTKRSWDEERVSFWLSIYTGYDSTQSVVHDNRYPHIIYEVLQFTSSGIMDIDKRTSIINETISKYQNILQKFDMGLAAFYQMTPDETRVYNLFKTVDDPDKFRDASSRDRIRVQDGRADSFKEALKRSSRFLSGMQTMLRTYNLPPQLIALVFVESLFYPKAQSKVGAAGPWQLMDYAARPHIIVGNDVDERFDPFLSTLAAAQILKENYEKLNGSWPLAITAYNHGLGGMLQAKKRHASEDLEEIIRNYRSSSFKFASKNFYAEYLAAVDAFTHHERYFGKMEMDPPLSYDRIRVPYPIKFKELAKTVELEESTLADFNPSLTDRVVMRGELPVPMGYALRLPVGKGTSAIQLLRDVEEKKKVRQVANKEYQATSLPLMHDEIYPNVQK